MMMRLSLAIVLLILAVCESGCHSISSLSLFIHCTAVLTQYLNGEKMRVVTLLGGSGGVVMSLDLPASLKSLGCFLFFVLFDTSGAYFLHNRWSTLYKTSSEQSVHYISHPLDKACTT